MFVDLCRHLMNFAGQCRLALTRSCCSTVGVERRLRVYTGCLGCRVVGQVAIAKDNRRMVLYFRRPSHERFQKNCGRGERHPGNARVTPCRSLGHAAGQEEAATQESGG